MLLGVRPVARAVVGRRRSIGYVGGGDGETITPAEELVYVPGRHLVAQHCDIVACLGYGIRNMKRSLMELPFNAARAEDLPSLQRIHPLD